MVKIEINDGLFIDPSNICAITICQRVKNFNKMITVFYAQFNMNDGKTYNSREFATEIEIKEWLNNVLN